MEQERHWLTRPATIRRLWIVFIAVLALTVAADFVVEHHAHFGFEGSFGFNAWYGLVACVALIAVAKGLGILLKRDEDYYDR